MILSPEQQEAICRAARDEVHERLNNRQITASMELIERAISLATIKHTVNAMIQPEGKEARDAA